MNYKRFIFPAFEYNGFKDTILFKGSQTSWKLYHVVFKKIAHSQVLHPGNYKQNVLIALEILHESTWEALTNYFPKKKISQNFLNFLTHGGWFNT